jgi:hypothetical protein
MYFETITALAKTATIIESELQSTWHSLNVKLIDFSEELLVLAFTYKMDANYYGSEYTTIKRSCFASDPVWRVAQDIQSREEFIQCVRSENLVERWNADFHSRDVSLMIHSLEHDVEDVLASREVELEVEKVSENLDERDVEEILEIVQGMNIIIRCDTADFWTEDMLIEEWELVLV